MKTIVRGCATLIAAVLFIVVVGLVIALVVFVVRYELWAQANKTMLDEVAVTEIENRDAVEYQMNKRLQNFQKSKVQRESMNLTCDMLGVMMENVLEDSWNLEHKDVGLTCGNRSMTVYIKMWDLWWVNVRIWQRAEGSIEFVVYDVNVGPFSLAGVTFGYLSEEISGGVGDAIDLVTGETYSGRRIEKMYISDDGMRMVGVLAEPVVEAE